MKTPIIKTALMFFAVLCCGLVACGEPENGVIGSADTLEPGEIGVRMERNVLLSDGQDAIELKVLLGLEDGKTEDVTAQSEIYVVGQTPPLTSPRFSTTTAGTYAIYAFYGMTMSADVLVYAYSELPEVPADEQPDNVTFAHRMMLVQHTGTGCVNCPRMMESLKELSEDDAYNTAYNHVASHSYMGGDPDPGYSEVAKYLSLAYCTGNYPQLTFNLTETSAGTDLQEIKNQVDALRKESVGVGISAESIATDGALLIEVGVKVATPGDYRIGVWVLEDNIYGIQAGAVQTWMHHHENVLRATATNVGSKTTFTGEDLVELKEGNTTSTFFRVEVEEGWKEENCKFLVFVTSRQDGVFDIANSIVCPINTAVGYDYK